MVDNIRKRDVIEEEGQVGSADLGHQRMAVDREQAKLYFSQIAAHAKRVQAILDSLGRGYTFSLEGASGQLKSAVQHLDPESKGEYISWELYKKCCDRMIAKSFPDMITYLKLKTGDKIADSELMKALMIEQMMAL